MSRKHFSWLLLVTFLVAAAVLMVPGKTGRESGIEKTVFLPGAAAQVNDIGWLRLTGAGGLVAATLKREGSAWQVEEASGYPADWGRVKSLLSDLSQAEIIETKTANPEYYARLGVEDVQSPEAGGVMIEFSPESGLPAVIIGKSAQGREGRYARVRDARASALIDRNLDAGGELADWLDRDIVDISDAEVVEVRIEHPDGGSIRAFKTSADDENFALQDIPEGREIKSDWSVDALAGALAALTLDGVAPDTTLGWGNASRYSLVTADGLLLEAELLKDEAEGEEHWIRLQAGLYTTALESGVEAEGEGPGDRAETINDRVSGWAYRIPGYKFEAMNKRMDDLLKPVESS
jgi:hypothetical protein